jgi:hypothetical protein
MHTGEIAVGRHTHSRDNDRQKYCTFMREKGRQTSVQYTRERMASKLTRKRGADMQIRERKAGRHIYRERIASRHP